VLMPSIKLEWSANSNIRNEAVRLAEPILKATAYLAHATRERITNTGRAGDNRNFRRYDKRTAAIRRKAGYQTRFKDFKRTGTFWGSLNVRLQSPTRASTRFSGKAGMGGKWGKRKYRSREKVHARAKKLVGQGRFGEAAEVMRTGQAKTYRRIGNADLARILNADERLSIMQPTANEIGVAIEDMAAMLTSEILTAQSIEQSAFTVARRTRSAVRRANKALAALGSNRRV